MTTILYQVGEFYVRAEKFGKTDGFAVYKNEGVAARRVASIGYTGQKGLGRAINEADFRNNRAAKIVPDNVKVGSREHLDALCTFFGI